MATLRDQGIDAFRRRLRDTVPWLGDRVDLLSSFDDIRLLNVQLSRLPRWYRDGLLCIGDAAHAMSPIGGVGVNLAVQDAVAAANILAGPMKDGPVSLAALRRVQKRREWPTKVTQRLQLLIQNNVIAPTLTARQMSGPPLVLRMLARWPYLPRLPARLVGMGVRPEHVALD